MTGATAFELGKVAGRKEVEANLQVVIEALERIKTGHMYDQQGKITMAYNIAAAALKEIDHDNTIC